MRQVHPFVLGHAAGALVVGVIAGAFFDWRAMLTFVTALVGGALVSSLVCWWRRDLQAAAWRLYVVACIGNPLFLAAAGYSIYDYECVLGWRKGWACFLSEVPPLAAGLCLLPPLFGLGWRWWRQRTALSL